MTVTADALAIGTITDYGDQALLLQFDSTAEVLAWNDVLRDAEVLGVVDIVPAARTVLVKLEGPRSAGIARQQLSKLRLAPEVLEATAPGDGAADVVIDVVYDGEDLDEVAELTGMTPRDVVAAHTADRRGGSDSAVSHRVSATSSAVTSGSTCRGGRSRAPRCPPVPSGWRASSAACTPGRRLAAGS